MIGPKVDICRKGTKPVSLQTTFFAKCRTGVFQIARFDGDSTRRVDPAAPIRIAKSAVPRHWAAGRTRPRLVQADPEYPGGV